PTAVSVGSPPRQNRAGLREPGTGPSILRRRDTHARQPTAQRRTRLLAILVVYVTMVYGPIAAWLVEMFRTRIRYSGVSLPYHIGNGWFGGFPAGAVLGLC